MNLSEAFEGKNSSLRQAFESTKEEVFGFRPSIDVEIPRAVDDYFAVVAMHPDIDKREQLKGVLDDIYARGCNDGAYEQRMLMEDERARMFEAILEAIRKEVTVDLGPDGMCEVEIGTTKVRNIIKDIAGLNETPPSR
jgi:hypothetical protein